MKQHITTAFLAVACACASTSVALAERLTISVTGSSTVAPAIMEIATAYEERHRNVRIDVQTGGSGKGLGDARSGKSDIGMVSRAPKDGETDLAWTRIANDGLAIVVHASNPVSKLTSDQVRALYLGQITNWSELGGKDKPVTLVHKAEGRSTLEVFLKALKLNNPDIKPQAIVGDNQQGIRTVSANPTAIGYVSIGAAATSVQDGLAVKLIILDGVPATTEAVVTGSYPLLRQLNIVTKHSPAPHVRAFVAFATSSEAALYIAEQGFVAPQR